MRMLKSIVCFPTGYELQNESTAKKFHMVNRKRKPTFQNFTKSNLPNWHGFFQILDLCELTKNHEKTKKAKTMKIPWQRHACSVVRQYQICAWWSRPWLTCFTRCSRRMSYSRQNHVSHDDKWWVIFAKNSICVEMKVCKTGNVKIHKHFHRNSKKVMSNVLGKY